MGGMSPDEGKARQWPLNPSLMPPLHGSRRVFGEAEAGEGMAE